MRKLYYVYDPMCSWCWGYRPTLQKVEASLSSLSIPYQKLVGGLAADSADPMPIAMQQAIQGYWRTISAKLGTQFNHDFWLNNTPRRSTYPACRALLVARQFALENEMNEAIQQAYYVDAKNPSDNDVLCALADDIGLNSDDFSRQLQSSRIQAELEDELKLARAIGGNSFPSWVLVDTPNEDQSPNNTAQYRSASLTLDYKDERALINTITLAFNE